MFTICKKPKHYEVQSQYEMYDKRGYVGNLNISIYNNALFVETCSLVEKHIFIDHETLKNHLKRICINHKIYINQIHIPKTIVKQPLELNDVLGHCICQELNDAHVYVRSPSFE